VDDVRVDSEQHAPDSRPPCQHGARRRVRPKDGYARRQTWLELHAHGIDDGDGVAGTGEPGNPAAGVDAVGRRDEREPHRRFGQRQVPGCAGSSVAEAPACKA
jgi:hypothetical protein